MTSLVQALSGLPWLLVVAAIALVAGVVGEVRGAAARRAALLLALRLALVTLATYALHRALALPGFFHQNGHGPMWVAYARCGAGPLGPGFAEVFGVAASRDPAHAEAAVFALQGALAALVPAAVYLVATGVGAAPWLAGGVALVAATEPVLARIASTESYYATTTSLLFVAAAVLAAWPSRAPRSDRRTALAAACAGLVVAQAARIHPLCWPAAALLPLVPAVRAGSVRARLREATVAGVVIALVVAATSGGEMLHVLDGSEGQGWLARVDLTETLARNATPGRLVVLAAAALWLRRDLLAIAALVVAFVVARLADLHGSSPPWVQAAYYVQYAPVALAAAAALLARWPGASAWPGRLAVAATLALAASRFAPMQQQATDTREQEAMLAWRDLVPPDASLVWLGRAGLRVLALPVYGDCARSAHHPIAADDAPAPLASLGRRVYYYRSSLCSSADGRAKCGEMEATARLVPLATAAIPARASMTGLGFDRDPVEVGLFRVEAPRDAP